MNKPLSISDDDICATCKHCIYTPGELSFCHKDWPYQQFKNWNDDIQKCLFYEQIDSEFGNWSKEALNYMTDSLITD
jgi:hypothetical protein